MKLTVVLTVYNKEPYLARALDALLNQHNVREGDYEVLAVNDGSTDGSLKILEEYALNYNHIRILTQHNQGLSEARNNGVKSALGDYIWFVDADDTVSKKSVSLLISAMSDNPDVIPIYAMTDGINRIRNKITPKLTKGKDIIVESKWEHCGVFWVLKKAFLENNNLFFFPNIYHEDAEFTPRMLYLAQSVKVVPEVLYTVFHCDQQSITEVPRPKRSYDMVLVVEHLMDFFEMNDENRTAVGVAMCNNNAGILNTAFYIILQSNKKEREDFTTFLYEKRTVLRSYSGASLFKYRMEGLLFRIFPKYSVFLFKIMNKIKI